MENNENLAAQMREVIQKVSSILQLLKGHELDRDDKGMVGIQNDHESRISKLEKMVANYKYFIYGISFPAAGGWQI